MKEFKPKYKREKSMLFKKFRERGDYRFVYQNDELKTIASLNVQNIFKIILLDICVVRL